MRIPRAMAGDHLMDLETTTLRGGASGGDRTLMRTGRLCHALKFPTPFVTNLYRDVEHIFERGRISKLMVRNYESKK